jgi:hypothetical protein
MKISLQFLPHLHAYKLTYEYAGIQFCIQLNKDETIGASTELHEKQIAELMNLCIQELQDLKRLKVLEEKENEGKVKFFGVDNL